MNKFPCGIVVLLLSLTAIGQSNPRSHPIASGHRHSRRHADRSSRQRAPAQPGNRDSRRQDRERRRRGFGTGPSRREGHRPVERDRAARPDRVAHPHLPTGGRPGARRLRHPVAEVSAGLPCGARDRVGSPCAGAGLHHHPRHGDRRRRLRRRRHQNGGERGPHSRAAHLHHHARLFPLPADIRWKATRRRSRCPRACRSSTVRSKRARPRASKWTTAPTGSRCT